MENYFSFVFSFMAMSGTNISNTFQPMRDNVYIPSMGFSAFTNGTELPTALNKALEVGYRYIDTSSLYENEDIIGSIVKNWTKSKKLNRKDLFITTKLHPLDMDPNKIEGALNDSLAKLQLQYVDSYVIDMPMGLKIEKDNEFEVSPPVKMLAIWRKMEDQVKAKRARSIGFRNFNKEQIEGILRIAKIQPSNIHIEVHPYHQQKDLRAFCKKNNIVVVGHAPLGPFREADMFIQLGPNEKGMDTLNDPAILNIAKKYKKTLAQIILRYLHQLQVVVLPRTLDADMIETNSKIFKFNLSMNDTKTIEMLDRGTYGKIYDLLYLAPNISEHPDYPFKQIEEKQQWN